MNVENFIKSLYESVIKDNNNVYKGSFLNADIPSDLDTIKDQYWKEALKLYTELSPESKDVLFKIFEQVQVDTTATILGILDGVVSIEDEDIEIKVTIKNDSEVISGDLLDLFLEYDEENR